MRLFPYLLFAAASHAAIITIDFEGLADDSAITTEFAGLTFSNTRALTAGITLNDLEFPPRSGSNVAGDIGGPIDINFTIPVLNFSGYFTYSTALTLTAFDALNQVVGSTNSAFSANTVSSQNTPNERLQLSFAGGIARVTLAGGVSGSTFTLDDLELTTPDSAEIPEPATWLLVAAALGVLRRK
ncbi:MAG: hypothetical protein FJW32_07230 [Acidobacteria bacterium]|nr:hypothetical protein [Acidobacteriota bacterium]